MTPNDFQDALAYAQTRLTRLARKNQPVTREAIEEAIENAFKEEPDWANTVEKSMLLETLIQRNSVWIGAPRVLEGEDEHVAWLKAERKINWRYWPRYQQHLAASMAETSIRALDDVTSTILGLLEDPLRKGPWDRRGLVVGHVQSGKTSNYTGVICKAADAGYKIIIVLAGIHKNLRSQTQMRLDEGFLGYETSPLRQGEHTTIGVGLIDPDRAIRPNYVTNRSDNGDFKTRDAAQLGITPEERPWLFVVKKNSTVLKQLLTWIQNHVADTDLPAAESGATADPLPQVRKLVTKLPLLVIDDEADHASVDTGDNAINEDGTPDLEHDPKTINKLIRRIIRSFSRSAYLGYTATPFANVFIHDQGCTHLEGDDLFPRSFIVNLPGPSNYAGPLKMFGGTPDDEGDSPAPGLPLIRTVSDYARSLDEGETEGWMPLGHKNGHTPLIDGQAEMPESLKEAVCSFILGCAIRELRGQKNKHCSMLIHVSRYTGVQREVVNQVQTYVDDIRQRLQRGIGTTDLLEKIEMLWHNDYKPTTVAISAILNNETTLLRPTWPQIKAALPLLVGDIKVKAINGTAKDALDYVENQGTGLKVIAIGGDKLARGLTLEGLTVSYFLRASRMYDTLMQMGRWFGYRPGYLDVCRLYTTAELTGWFQHITVANEELRKEFDYMSVTGGTPKQYGIRIRSHPILLVTSRVKMRAAKELELSYSGDSVETTVLFRNPGILRDNFRAAEKFITALPAPNAAHQQERPDGKKAVWSNALVWENVSHEHVESFLSAYKTHDEAYKVNSKLLVKFIEEMARKRELTHWTVAVLGAKNDSMPVKLGGFTIQAVERKQDERAKQTENRFVIRRLLSPRDEAIDLDEKAYTAALKHTRTAAALDPAREEKRRTPAEIMEPNGPAIRNVRGLGNEQFAVPAHPERGVLLIYPIDSSSIKDLEVPIVAIGISFPGSKQSTKVKYQVNNVYWGMEFGGATEE